MAVYYARKSGNINAADVWATSPTGTAGDFFSSFTNADTLMSNAFTITVNVNATVLEIRNDTSNGSAAGGSFALSNGITLTSNIIGANCCGFSGALSATIIGNITGNSHQATNLLAGVVNSGVGTLTITGSVTGGTIQLSYGANNSGTGTLIVVGNVSGGSIGSSTTGVANTNAGTVIITGNVTGTTANGVGVTNTSTGSVTITGNVAGGTNGTAHGVINTSNGSVTITGSCTAGSTGSAVVNSGAAGTITIDGTCTGAAVVGASNSSTGILIVKRAKGGPLATSAVGVSSGASSATSIEEIEYGDLGASPVSGPIRLTNQTSNVAIMYRFGSTKKTLIDTASTNLLPSANNVRFGTIYNAGQSTGTMSVPSASSVVLGVSVDNTTGTAAISSSAIQSACDNAITSFNDGRLSNVATITSTSQQIAQIISG